MGRKDEVEGGGWRTYDLALAERGIGCTAVYAPTPWMEWQETGAQEPGIKG